MRCLSKLDTGAGLAYRIGEFDGIDRAFFPLEPGWADERPWRELGARPSPFFPLGRAAESLGWW